MVDKSLTRIPRSVKNRDFPENIRGAGASIR
jgi:hypothetical protein